MFYLIDVFHCKVGKGEIPRLCVVEGPKVDDRVRGLHRKGVRGLVISLDIHQVKW